MLQSRRGFLIGAGSLLAAAFVKEASAFVRSTGLPLLVTPSEPTYWLFWDDFYRQFNLGQRLGTSRLRVQAGGNF